MNHKIGFIGMGKMGQAIWQGLEKINFLPKSQIFFNEQIPEIEAEVINKFGIKELNLANLVEKTDVIFFCVKPQNLVHLCQNFPKINLNNKIFVSILAGTPIKKFETLLGKDIRLIRTMPNNPLLINYGMTAICYNKNVKEADKEIIKKIFGSLGEIIETEEEHLNVVTGISGSGPAFLYRIADDLAKLGVEHGLTYQNALLLIAQTMVGSGKMLLLGKHSPEELIQIVKSPKGTTEAGLNYFDTTDIDNEIKNVVKRTIERARELSRGD